jgi:hypothetical protein
MSTSSAAAADRSAIFRIILIAPSLRVEETDDRSRARFEALCCPLVPTFVGNWADLLAPSEIKPLPRKAPDLNNHWGMKTLDILYSEPFPVSDESKDGWYHVLG